MGILGDAGIKANDVPDSPYDFGTEFWPIQVIAVGDKNVTKNGDKYGFQIVWKSLRHPHMEKLGHGNWLQLPPPEGLIPFDANSQEGKEVLYAVRRLFYALGFKADEMENVDTPDLIGRACLGKIFPKQDENGFWKFNIPVGILKPLPEGGLDGLNEFATPGSNSNPADDVAAAMAREMEAEANNA